MAGLIRPRLRDFAPRVRLAYAIPGANVRVASLRILTVTVGVLGLVAATRPSRPAPTSDRSAGASSTDSADVAAAAERFRAALSRGDSATVLAMLAPDLQVLESGGLEDRAEYRRHHLPADIEYARALHATHKVSAVVVHGDAAWVTSTSISQGTVRGRTINSAGAELLVLSRAGARAPWQIRAIHWSSRKRT
jgi:ketosteroid isomerase-like protein